MRQYFTKRSFYVYIVGFPAIMLTWLFYNRDMALDLAEEMLDMLNFMENKND